MAVRSRPRGFRRGATSACRRALSCVLAAAPVVLGGCATPSFGAPKPASRQAGHTLGLWQGTVIAALAVGVVVWSLIIWSIVRYRRRNDDIPRQTLENIPLEIFYTAVPILIIAGLFFFTLRTQTKTNRVAKRPDLTVDVIGFQWQWQFRYPGEGVTITGDSEGRRPQLVLPVGKTVQLNLEADDVNHSFWVPRFLSKRDLIPGVRNRINVNVTKPGTFVGRCAEFCGLDHWRMNFEVRAVSQADYESWLRDQRAGRSS